MKFSKTLLVIALIAFVPTLPYALVGYGGIDFARHVPSWWELANHWRSGQLFPCWAGGANYGLGDARFCYYPPVSFMIGAALVLLLPIRIAPAAYIWLAFVISGLSMYFASSSFIAENDRTKAAAIYMVSPYLILSALVNFDAAELLTQAWLPLVFAFFYQTLWLKQSRSMLLLACTLALTWITNVPASIVLLYSLIAVAMITSAHQRSAWPIIRFLTSEAIASILAAFYLLPTWAGQSLINKSGILYDFREFFVFAPARSLSDLGPFRLTCWLLACGAAALTIVYVLSSRRRLREDDATLTWVEISLVSFFFQLPLSAFLWRHLPQLLFADFPVRFLAQGSVAVPLILFSPSTRRMWRVPSVIAICLLALLPFALYLAPVGFRHQLRTRFEPYRFPDLSRVYESSNERMRTPTIADPISQWKSVGYPRWDPFVLQGEAVLDAPTQAISPSHTQLLAAYSKVHTTGIIISILSIVFVVLLLFTRFRGSERIQFVALLHTNH